MEVTGPIQNDQRHHENDGGERSEPTERLDVEVIHDSRW